MQPAFEVWGRPRRREEQRGFDFANVPDYCTRSGATELKEKIEAYWRERGQNVEIHLVDYGFSPVMRSARYDLRSDMVNGYPRKTHVSVKNAA